MDFPARIVDASAILAILYHDEDGDSVESIVEDILSRNGQFFVPAIFWFEVGNSLSTAYRRKRVSLIEIQRIEDILSNLPIITDPIPDTTTRIRIREIAIEYELSYYDAAYIELSQRLQIELISLDKKINDVIS